MANGSVAFLRTRRVSMVSGMVAAVRAVSLDAANHHLDGEYSAHILRLAFARAWTPVDSSWLDSVAGIRVRRSDGCHYPVAAKRSASHGAELNGNRTFMLVLPTLCQVNKQKLNFTKSLF